MKQEQLEHEILMLNLNNRKGNKIKSPISCHVCTALVGMKYVYLEARYTSKYVCSFIHECLLYLL